MDQLTPVMSHLFRASGAGPAERGRLDATLTRVGEVYQALQEGRTDVDAAAVLSQLHVDFAMHFALEESDEYFGAVLRERPSMSHELAELKRDHAVLLQELERLRELASGEQRPPEISAAIMRIVTDFRAHERKEADLMQESVLRDDGVGD
jgi:hypothetical protein